MRLEHVRPAAWPRVRAGKLANLIRTDSPDSCHVALLGLPDDTGVRLNHGVPGAAEGPNAFRRALAGYGVDSPAGWSWPTVFDAGDVTPGADLDETHARVTSAAEALLDQGMLPVAIGGGHDLTYPFVRAVAGRSADLSGVYLDAHLDVREVPGSGMPFRRLIETCGVKHLDVIGLDPYANSREHVDWFSAHGGRIDELDSSGAWRTDEVFVSIDLDAIDAAHAPGVSARNPSGLPVGVAAAWAYSAGARTSVRCFDIMELCPPRDSDGRTARVAALLFLRFLHGVAHRPGGAR